MFLLFCLRLCFSLKHLEVQCVPPQKWRLGYSFPASLAKLLGGSEEQPLVKPSEYKNIPLRIIHSDFSYIGRNTEEAKAPRWPIDDDMQEFESYLKSYL